MDLKKAHDRVDRDALWKCSRINGVRRELLEAARHFYQVYVACVGISRKESEKVALCQNGCLIYARMGWRRRLMQGSRRESEYAVCMEGVPQT